MGIIIELLGRGLKQCKILLYIKKRNINRLVNIETLYYSPPGVGGGEGEAINKIKSPIISWKIFGTNI